MHSGAWQFPLMGWSGRAPAPLAARLARGTKDKEHAMAETLKTAVAVIGIDIGKNSFHVVGQDQRGAIVLRQKWSRGQVESRFANMPPCLIGMEACVGAHHLSRRLKALVLDSRCLSDYVDRRSGRARAPRRRRACRNATCAWQEATKSE